MMLYLITKQLTMRVGEYRVEQIDPNIAAALIRTNFEASKLKSLIHFGSTAFAIEALTALHIELVDRPDSPILNNDDLAIEIRLRPDVGRGKVQLADLEFYLIRFRTDYEAKQQAPSMWPAVMD
jgi:hypothetical protein